MNYIRSRFKHVHILNHIKELLTLKRTLKEKTAEEQKKESESVQAPGIQNLLPHLRGNKQALIPAKRISKGRSGVSLAFGIPTIRRANATYLLSTIGMITRLLLKFLRIIISSGLHRKQHGGFDSNGRRIAKPTLFHPGSVLYLIWVNIWAEAILCEGELRKKLKKM